MSAAVSNNSNDAAAAATTNEIPIADEVDQMVALSFACVDLNELWAAAIPVLEDDEQHQAIDETTLTADTNDDSPLELPNEDLILDEVNGETEVTISQFKTKDKEQQQQQQQQQQALPIPDVLHERTTEGDDLEKGGTEEAPLPTQTTASFSNNAVLAFKHIYSGVLLAFCIIVVSAAIFNKQTTATADTNTHPFVAFLVFWFLILWLALMEGGLNCMVGLKPIESDLYAESHRLTRMCTKLAHKGDNLERFIVGRQFLDLTCVFLTSFMVSSIDGASVLGLPAIVNDIFLGAGVAVILVTIVIGQLVSQINAAHCMLDFINNYVMVATTYAALTLENSGLLHATYLVQITIAKLAGKKIESAEGHKTARQKAWFWTRVVGSTAILGLAFAVTIKALFDGTTTMWSGVPAPASIGLFVLLILVVGNMEGLQIAMFAVVHLPEEELAKHPVALKNCRLTFRGSNLQAFLVGRQIFQTILMFIIARITTLDVGEGDDNVFGVSDGLQQFFNTGLLGALISTIIASLSWRIMASTFPIVFLSSPFANVTIRFCLLVEHTGICTIAWLLAAVHKRLVGLKNDEVHVGSTTERTTAEKESQHLERIEEGCTSSETSQ